MNEIVSKVRKKSTKKREKKVVRDANADRAFMDGPVMGFMIVVMLWGIVMFGFRSRLLVENWPSAATVLPLLGDSVYALVGLFAVGFYLSVVRPEYLRRNSRLVLLTLISLLSLALVSGLTYATNRPGLVPDSILPFLLPLAIAPLLTTILLGGKAGFAVGVWTSLVCALFMDRSIHVLIEGLIVTAVACYCARSVRTRTKAIRVGVVIGMAQILCVLGARALAWQDQDVMVVLHQAVACVASGVGSAVVVLLVMPLFEHLFAITTDISLLEFSDFGHPLLQRLAIEAPGTYHHSLVVASLAQAAADAIGANSLEARVCSYFHDIGKLVKPGFFSENIHMQTNPHDDLPPSMSTLVITAHVKEGLSLATLHKLPRSVLNVIQEHHGTSVLSCFHSKAQSQLEFEMGSRDNGRGTTRLDDCSFRYPGPKPQSKVSAIVCIADAVEAASRSIEKTTPAHLEGLVNDIVKIRLDDGQLDECDLELSELTKTKRSFVFTLTTMLHGRVPYPNDANRDKQPTRSAQNKPTNGESPDPLANEQGNHRQ